jgi:hypothetical protein
MPHFPKPFFRPKKNRWYVQLDGKQANLGPDEAAAFRCYHDLMAERATPRPVKPALTEQPLVVTILDAFLDWLATALQKAQRPSEPTTGIRATSTPSPRSPTATSASATSRWTAWSRSTSTTGLTPSPAGRRANRGAVGRRAAEGPFHEPTRFTAVGPGVALGLHSRLALWRHGDLNDAGHGVPPDG